MLKLKRFLSLFVCAGLAQVIYIPLSQAERHPVLPPPYATASAQKTSTVIGWPKGKTPRAASGFVVQEFLSLEKPRSLFLLPSGNVLVSQAAKTPRDSGEKSPNKISLLKIKNGKLEGVSTFAEDLNLPFGMAVWGSQFFIGEPDRVLVFPYKDEKLTGPGRAIAELPFPQPQRHWTRHLLINSEGTKIYVSVGSASNVGELPDPHDPHSATVLEMNLDGSHQKVFASGVRNAVSMAWEPVTRELWAVVNERDELGDDLVPDYITPLHDGDFYGWPYAYWGNHEDPRLKGIRPDLVAKSKTPYFSMGPHTAALGIVFSTGTKLVAPFNKGALITEHGSWNRSVLSGYGVRYVEFVNGKPIDNEFDFLTGFIADEGSAKVYGRPVASIILADGSVLVSDDGGGKIWRVSRR